MSPRPRSLRSRVAGAARYHAVRAAETARSFLWEARSLGARPAVRRAVRRLRAAGAPTIAVFHQGGIGNGLLLGPLLQNVRARWPDATVHLFAYQPQDGEVLRAGGLVQRATRVRPGDRAAIDDGGVPFDLLLSAARTVEGGHVARRIAARLKVGLRYRAGWHSRSRFGHDLAVEVAADAHEAVANNSMLGLLLGEAPPPPDRVLPANCAPLSRAAPRPARTRIAVHAGCSQSSAWKRYPLERMAAACRWLQSHHDAELVLIAGPDERADVSRLASQLGGDTTVLDAPARFLDLFEFLRSCHCLVSNDSGIMHLAAAAGCPVVAIFGPTDDRLTGPWTPPEARRIVSEPLACRPCYVIYSGSMHCTHREQLSCLRSVQVDAVVEAVAELLGSTSRAEVTPAPAPAAG